MECYTGFVIECKTNSDAEQIAKAMKEYFEGVGLSDHYLVKKINVVGSTVRQGEDFCTDNFWGDTFERMCLSVDSLYPNLMIRGESNYEESYGIISQVSFERKDNGIIFSKRCEDPDFIIAMDEEGVPLEKIAEITGLPVEELEALLGYTVDEDAEYEEY